MSTSSGTSTSCAVTCTKPTFIDRLQTLRVQHAVVQGGQAIFWLVFTTLFLGDNLDDIKGFLESQLGSKRQYKDSFTKPEQEKLEQGNHRNWDISLLFKLLQKVCGLDKKVSDWKRFGRDTLEKLLDELKDLRNEMAHDFDCVLTLKERDENLEKLRNLCLEILTKLNDKAQIGNEAVHRHFDSIDCILNDVKKPINESLIGSIQIGSTEGTISKNSISSPGTPTPSFASDSVGIASAAGDFSKSAFSAAACSDFAVAEGYPKSVDLSHDGAEGMEVDDSNEITSGENSIINQLVKSFWNIAGPGFITV